MKVSSSFARYLKIFDNFNTSFRLLSFVRDVTADLKLKLKVSYENIESFSQFNNKIVLREDENLFYLGFTLGPVNIDKPQLKVKPTTSAPKIIDYRGRELFENSELYYLILDYVSHIDYYTDKTIVWLIVPYIDNVSKGSKEDIIHWIRCGYVHNSVNRGWPYFSIQEIKDYPFKEESKVNDKRLIIDNYGAVLYIPLIDRIENYKNRLKSFENDVLGAEDPSKKGIIYSDDYHIVFIGKSYDRIGIKTETFEKYSRLNNTKITQVLESFYTPAIVDQIKNFVDFKIDYTLDDIGWFLNRSISSEEELVSLVGHYNPDFANFYNNLYNFYSKVRKESEYAQPWKLGYFKDNTSVPLFRKIYKAFVKAREDLLKILDQDNIDVFDVLNVIGLLTVVIEYADADLKEYKPTGSETYTPKLPYLQEVSLLPHQAKALSILNSAPDNAILDIAAGGGKTIIGLLDILQMLNLKKIKRPLILCPDRAIKNYINESYHLTKGKLLLYPITTENYKDIPSFVDLVDYLSSAPPNVVVIASYSWASGAYSKSKEAITVGSKVVELPSSVVLLKKIGFDYVLLDESHKLSDVDSETYQGVFSIVSGIRYKRLASGTLIHYKPSRLFTQLKLLDFNVSKHLVRDYYEYDEQPSTEVLKGLLKKFTVISASRLDWAWLLPDKIENTHIVELDDKYFEMYKDLIERVTKKVHYNTTENQLSLHFQEVEYFLAALDNKVVSPKFAKAFEIIDSHLSNEGKIVVFTKYRKTAELFHRRLLERRVKALFFRPNKKEILETFEKDSSVRVMVGVEDSLVDSLNLQFCTRIIRLELPWSPGTFEQSESRLFRPNIKGKRYDTIYIDTILCNRTIDILKASRLFNLVLSFYKQKEEYKDLLKYYVGGVVSLSIDNLKSFYDYNDIVFKYNFDLYKRLRDYERTLLDQQREKQKSTFVNTYQDADLPGTNSLIFLPLVEGAKYPFHDELGLVNYNDYVSYNDEYTLVGKKAIVSSIFGSVHQIDSIERDKIYVKSKHGKVGYPKAKALILTKEIDNLHKILKGLFINVYKIVGNKIITIGDEQKIEESLKKDADQLVKILKKDDEKEKTEKILKDIQLRSVDTPEQRIQETQPKSEKPKPAVEKPKSADTPEQRIQTKPVEKPRPADTPEQRIQTKPVEKPNLQPKDIKKEIDSIKEAKTKGLSEKELLDLIKRLDNIDKKLNFLLENEETKPDGGIYIAPVILNGMITFFVDRSDSDLVPYIKTFGFKKSGKYYWLKIRSKNHYIEVLNKIRKYVNPERMAKLEQLQFNKPTAEIVNDMQIKNFYLITRFRRKIINPYPIIWNNKIFLYIPFNENPNMSKVLKTDSWKTSSGDYFIILNNKQDAISTLKKINEQVTVYNYDEVLRTIQKIKI